MVVRKAESIDKEEILKLVEGLYNQDSPESVESFRKNFIELIDYILVFEEENKIVGYILYEIHKKSLYIADIYVLEEFRRRKIANKLLEEIEKIKKKLKKDYLRVDVRKKDIPAVNFYKKIGFKFWKEKNINSVILKR